MLPSNLLERPKCFNFDKCHSEGFIVAYKMCLCGDCLLEIYQKMSQKQSDYVKEILNSDAS